MTGAARSARYQPERLFHPRVLAVLGAATPEAAEMLANLRSGSFAGSLLEAPATPEAIAALPDAPDLAVLGATASALPALFAALAVRGCGAAIVPGPADDLGAIARQTGVRALGPGSFGLAVPGIGLNASRAHIPVPAGRLALVSQSTALSRAVLDWAGPHGIGFSHMIGLGGNADLGFGAALDWLSRDPTAGLVLLDIRSIKDRRSFVSAARAAAQRCVVVAIRAGTRLADPDGSAEAAFAAALQRAGVLTVGRFEELLAAAETLARAPPARDETLAVISNGIGPGRMAADAALHEGIPLARLSAEMRSALLRSLPAAEMVAGPIHVPPEQPVRLAEAASMLAAAPGVGGILALHAPTGPADAAGIAALAACAGTLKLPLLVCAMGETTGADHRHRLTEAGLPVFSTPAQAVRGFAHLVRQRRARQAARELPPRAVLALAPDHAVVRAAFSASRIAGNAALTQGAALDVLAAYGIPVVPARRVASAEDAADAAAMLGFPVVLKRARDAPPVGKGIGIAFDLQDRAAVIRAAALSARHADPAPGFVVQRQVGRGREVLIRVSEDTLVGPTIFFGPGGTTAESAVLAADLPPLNLTLAEALVRRSMASRLLDAQRDRPAANREAVAETLVRVSQLIVDFPEIAALELNPLFVDADGVLAADAWISLRSPGERGRLAILPYPAELTERWQADGENFVIRPIRPEDAEAHLALFDRLAPEDVRYRFFAAVRALSPEQIVRMTQIDYEREMAFIAVREASGETVGVARLVCDVPGGSGEFAIIVQPDMKHRGLARHLMQRLIEWAREQGMTEIEGQILAENTPMLRFARRLGFSLHHLPDDETVLEARLALSGDG